MPEVHLLKDQTVMIGVYTGRGAEYACIIAGERMLEWMGYDVVRIGADSINSGDIRTIDIFYFPGGDHRPYLTDIDPVGVKNLRSMIASGSGYIGTCAGAVYASRRIFYYNGYIASTGNLDLFAGLSKGPIENFPRNPSFRNDRVQMCQVDLLKPHPITDGVADPIHVLYYGGPYFVPDGDDVQIIGTYHATGAPALLACAYGKGRVFLTGPHPEWEEDDYRDNVSYFDGFDDQGSEWPLMQNAVLWCLHELPFL